MVSWSDSYCQWSHTGADVLAEGLCTGRGPQSGNSKPSNPGPLAGKPLLPQQLVLPVGPQKCCLVLQSSHPTPLCLSSHPKSQARVFTVSKTHSRHSINITE